MLFSHFFSRALSFLLVWANSEWNKDPFREISDAAPVRFLMIIQWPAATDDDDDHTADDHTADDHTAERKCRCRERVTPMMAIRTNSTRLEACRVNR